MKALHINLNTCLMRPLAAAFVAVLVLSGCATRDKDGIGKDDAFMQHWQNQSVDRQGFSPALEDLAPEPRVLMKQQSVNLHGTPRALPDQPITLKLQNAAVESVLRAMASAANVSLMMSSGVSDKISLNVKNARWSDVFQSILRSNGLDYRWQGKILQVMTAAHSGDMMVQVVNVRYSDAASLKNSLTRFVSRNKDAVIEIDQHNNALVIQGTPTEQARILTLIDSLDRPRPQVQLKAYIVETTKEKARELGMQWGGRFEHQKLIGGSGSTPLKKGGDGSTNTISGFPLGLGYGSIVNSSGAGTLGLAFGKTSVLEAQLNLMESEGVLNILSSPSITTLDNKMAYTENGEKVPYVSKDDDGDTSVKFEDAVLRLEMTPNVIDPANLKLKVLIKKDEVDASRSVQGNPYIVKKQTETTVLVRSGETIVISGLTKEKGTNQEAGVPGMRDLPGGKYAFGSTNRNVSMEEVLIFITPTILPTRAESGRRSAPLPQSPAVLTPGSR
ncbi:secretin N-terminal domain-containing protein [uncultured Duodenibacillus sp.]|uniref:secretin N-terminal domain-containing protein n=1 Tax=uncultured Duodenibacillus sp. TaxID=1980699 RepID=UPI00258B0C54|nr:secretin N-terminal domain-containing protein [uncultured Duodenibacillus sp.]